MNYQDVLKDILTMVEEVGAYQLEAKKTGDYNVNTKGDNVDYVTDIDVESERRIVAAIHAKYPDHAILAEESGLTDKESDYKWVIDPIDGTTNYVHNFPMHAISIALKHKEETVVGVVKLPRINMCFSAIKGEGACLNGEPMHVSNVKELGQSIIGTGFPYTRKHFNPGLPYFNDMVADIAGFRRTGSAATDLCLVAAGMLDGYWEFGINEWDIAAGILCIEEAGGRCTVTEKHGALLVITGNADIHDILVERVFNKSI